MAKHIQLSIADPCHEDWDAMTPTEKGKFCGSCQKQVVDFTGMTDMQIAAFFKKKTDGSVCGRFYNDQLDKDLAIPKKRIPWVKYFFQLTLPLFLTSLKSSAQKGKVAVKTIETPTVCQTYMLGAVAPPKEIEIQKNLPVIIKGMVRDEEGNPIPYCSIYIKGTKLGTAADSSGAFTLVFPEKTKKLVLVVSCVGFTSQESVISAQTIKEGKPIFIDLKANVMGEVVVVGYGTTKGRVVMGGSVSITKGETIYSEIKKEEPKSINTLKIYPNPLQGGTSVYIDCKKLEEGYYSFRLLNLSGQQVMQKEVWIDKEAGLLNMPVPSVAAGSYFVSMINKKTGKRFSERLVISSPR